MEIIVKPQQLIKDLIITDKKQIEKYNKEFQYKFFIPPEEKQTLDKEIIESLCYVDSAKEKGEIHSIYVAVCDNDPLKSDRLSPVRTHGRIPDGKHRYEQSLLADYKWQVKYIQVTDFEHYLSIVHHFDSVKTKPDIQKKFLIESFAEHLFNEGKIPRHKISAKIISVWMPVNAASRRTLYNWIPSKYKDPSKVRTAAQLNAQKKVSKKDRRIKELETELDATRREVFNLQEQVKEKDKIIAQLQDK